MMMKKHITRTLIASAVLFSFNSTAATSYFEARNDAMGGTGVASSHYGVAPLANPALLTKSGAKDDFSLLLPSVGAQLSDPGNITDNADKISDDWKAFERAVDACTRRVRKGKAQAFGRAVYMFCHRCSSKPFWLVILE